MLAIIALFFAWERLLYGPEVIIITSATVVALGVIWRKVVRPVLEWLRDLKRWMRRTETALSWVEAQMKPNCGSSLVDKVNLLLVHDSERDVEGRRYQNNNNQEEP